MRKVDTSRKDGNTTVAESAPLKRSHGRQGAWFVDNHLGHAAQRKPLEVADSPRGERVAQPKFTSDHHSLPIQRYSEQQSTDVSDPQATWDAREEMGIAIKSKMNHNVAVDYNDEENFARSSKGGHAENFVFSKFAIKRGETTELNIVSEREPCGDCEENLRHLEEVADPELEISIDYFIDYEEGKGGDELWDYYQEKLFSDSSESSESEMSDSE